MKSWLALTLSAALVVAARGESSDKAMNDNKASSAGTELATFGGGCFWCVEAAFELVDGVKSAVSGYAAGKTKDPTYKQVCGGDTGHAEVVQIEFDPHIVSYERLLELFWTIHDPTTLNRQGNDVGTQYRSIIICHSDAQKLAAAKSKAAAQREFARPIVTEIVPLTKFYVAEAYHQDYFKNNPGQGYCQAVVAPKIKKFKKQLGKE